MNQNIQDVDLLDQGINLFKKGQYAQSLTYIRRVLEKDENSADAYFYLGNIFHMRGELGKAIKAFNKVLSLQPNHTDAAISLSILYNDIGRYEEGKKIFDQASERVKGSSGVEDQFVNKKFAQKHLELAELYFSYNRYDEALFEYNKVISLDPTKLETRIKIAKVYSKKGFSAKAFDELRSLKNEHPHFLDGRVALGVLHYGNGNIIEAQTEWEKVLVRDPGHEGAKMYLKLSKTAKETTLN